MMVLLTGASGFIGSRLADALEQDGHSLVCALRDPARMQALHPARRCLAIDFGRAQRAEDWLPALAGVDAVVNTVGIIAERGPQRFETLHVRAPMALFDAAAQAGVSRVLQVSALGADEQAGTAYHLSKKQADDHLLSLPLSAAVVMPSLVFGPGGGSAALFLRLAALPLLVVPAGAGQVQPVHLDDLVGVMRRLLAGAGGGWCGRIAVVGPEPLSLAAYLQALRRAMGLPRGLTIALPDALMIPAVALASGLPQSLLRADTWQMLRRGNTADAAPTARLLGRAPRPPERFVEPAQRRATALRAVMAWGLPLLRWAIALVWLATALLSFGVYPVADSLALLARTGVGGAWAGPMLMGAAGLDLLLGIATLARPSRWLWRVQIGLIVFYTAVITLRLPEYWLHPYGPVLKNLPMLAALLLLHALEERRA